ncbi:MAG: nitroreductase family protein [Muribaculaceae bacterium]|nr:nitroreductase family protein [Muribaculaceae bacterium]
MENKGIEKIMESNPAYRNIVERTSVRRYADREVNDEFKEALIYAAMSAPSGVNRQPWEFIVVDDKGILSRLSESLPYAKMETAAPVAIVVCGNRDRFLDGDDATLWEQDLSASSENILLAAHALGLGAVWTCLYPHPDREEAVRKILNIPDNLIPFNLIPVGYPLTDHKPMDKWHPERIHRNKIVHNNFKDNE